MNTTTSTVGSAASPRRDLAAAPYLDALKGRTPFRRPVWFMRQAGRSLPEYRRVREGVAMLDACLTPDLLAEITLQPVRRHDVDAAILFSDIVVPLKQAGIALDIVPGTGPVVEHPLRSRADVEALPELDPASLAPIQEGIAGILAELSDTTALIGFAGAPFTLASYLVEGGPSRHHEHTKALMYSDPETWDLLLTKLSAITQVFLQAQVDAGVDAIQLFDSWVGALSLADYRTRVLPHSAHVFNTVASAGLPSTHFGVGTGELLGALGEAGPTMVGVDWRVPLTEAARRVPGKALQGNLDPAVLHGSPEVVDREVARVLAEADAAIAAGARGHVFNLGHGVLPSTDPNVLTRVVDRVHAHSEEN